MQKVGENSSTWIKPDQGIAKCCSSYDKLLLLQDTNSPEGDDKIIEQKRIHDVLITTFFVVSPWVASEFELVLGSQNFDLYSHLIGGQNT